MKNELLFSLFGICFKKEAISTIRMLRSTKKSRPFMIPHSDKPFSLAKKIFDSTTKPFFLLFCGNKLFCSLSYLSRSNTTPRPPLRGPPPPPWKKASPWPCTSSSSSYPHTLLLLWCGGIFFAAHSHPCFPTMAAEREKSSGSFFASFLFFGGGSGNKPSWLRKFLSLPSHIDVGGEKRRKSRLIPDFPFPFSPLSLVFSLSPQRRDAGGGEDSPGKKGNREGKIFIFLFETERLDTRVKFPTLVIAPSAVKKRQKIA